MLSALSTKVAFHDLRLALIMFAITAALPMPHCLADAAPGPPSWIWTQEHTPNDVPIGECYFRKIIHLPKDATGYVEIAADDQYHVYVNGRSIGEGSSSKTLERFDLGNSLRKGRNVIAVRVDNRNGTTAGLAARVHVETGEPGGRFYLTNPTWRANTSVLPLWNTLTYADNRWKGCRSLGPFGSGPPGGPRGQDVATARLSNQEKAVKADNGKTASNKAATGNTASDKTAIVKERKVSPGEHPQFKLPAGFEVEHVLGDEDTGSLIALSFNEFGQLLASRENGPLLVITDENDNGVVDSARTCCERVRNCQGILSVSGRAFVVGEGPEGVALYRLEDQDRDGNYETVESLVRFEGPIGEHGPHGMTLGPDGMIYLSLGNHSKLVEPVALTSPHHGYYEGDVVPKYEDPRGHALGVKAPGGGVLRLDLEGTRKELFAGGVRNAYDLAFNGSGDLFMHDSDMESDLGTPWHRPTRLLHIIPGGEYGWRSGWSKWPEYFVDSLPGVMDTGRGSPTGIVYYNHTAYPENYRGVMFSCDWAQGQIVAFRMKQTGASYQATRDVFLEGRPLNVTDIDVGPDGWLYFCTGGRGTKGNLYRVVSKHTTGEVPPLESVAQAVKHPQLDSAWARQRISVLRHKLGPVWDQQVRAVATAPSRPVADRIQAITLMHLMGPPPTDHDLVALSMAEQPEIRVQACFLMGLIGNNVTQSRLLQLLSDPDPHVRRHACEALARGGQPVGWDQLVSSLRSTDRFEAWAARRLLERNATLDWYPRVLETKNPNEFINGALAVMIAHPQAERAKAIVDRAVGLMKGFIPASEEVAILRVMQVAMLQGNLQGEDTPELAEALQRRFPQDNLLVNRELIRLLVGLQHAPAIPAILNYLGTDIPSEDKVHVAAQVHFLSEGWPPSGKFKLLQFLEQAKVMSGGQNLAGYISAIAEEVNQGLTVGERMYVIQQGHLMPETALTAMFSLPESADEQMFAKLVQLDQSLLPYKGVAYDRLRVGIVAMLARTKTPQAMGYLREIHDRDPERRQTVAMGLAQQPEGRNWDYLVRSIPLLDGEPAREVLSQLKTVDYAPEDPEHFRQVILSGLRLQDDGGMLAVELLQHWAGSQPQDQGSTWDTALASWQRWFDQQYPSQPLADLPAESGGNTWTFDDLSAYLSSPAAEEGSVERGAEVFAKAQCAACHIHGKSGIHLGPDLTTVARRFQSREVLESIIYPSQVISDQYASKVVVTKDGRSRVGMLLTQNKDHLVLANEQGEEIRINVEDVEEIQPSKTSVMPEGLLNSLSLEEVGDLFAFLMFVEEPRMVEFMEDLEVR